MENLILKFFLVLVFSLAPLFAQWEPDQRITFNDSSSNLSLDRCVVSIEDTVHIVWYDKRDGNDEIYYKRSTDGGENWGIDTRLTSDAAASSLPSIAISNSNVHVIWEEYRDGNLEIYYKRSTDGGENWEPDIRLTNNPNSRQRPSIAVSGQDVHVVWYDNRDGNYEIYYKRSTDGGENWGIDTRLTFALNNSRLPSIAVWDLDVYIAWDDNRDGNYEIYYKCSTDGGENWGADIRLTNDADYSLGPSIAASGSNIHVVWNKHNGNCEIYYKRSTDAGESWGTDMCVSSSSGNYIPSITASGLNVHAVWENVYGLLNIEIQYNCSTDGGVNWGNDIRLTNSSGYSDLPSVAVSGSSIHVVWTDDRDGNKEIYCKRNPTGNPAVEETPVVKKRDPKVILSVVPNPFVSYFRIIGHESEDFAVYDVSGRLLAIYQGDRVGADLPPGVYIIESVSDISIPLSIVKIR